MLFDEILEGIKTVLEADADTKDVIKLYRKFDVTEQGISNIPFAIIGPILNADVAAEYIGSLHRFEVPIAIQLLSKSYNTPARHQAAMDILDKLQHDVCDAINSNPKLSNTVLDSSIAGLRYIRPTEEYVGYEIEIKIKTNVE